MNVFREIILMPDRFDRSIAPERLPPNIARKIQRIDAYGSLARSRGHARTQVGASSSTVTACFVFHTLSGKLMTVDGNTGGAVRVTPGDGTKNNSGPLNEWSDSADTEP